MATEGNNSGTSPDSEPVWKRVDRRVSEKGFYRLNLVNPDDGVTERVATIRARENTGSVGDWDLYENGVEVCNEAGVISPSTIAEEFYDRGARTFDYNAIRDALVETRYRHKENPRRHAGQPVGSIKRFIEEMTEGTPVLGNFPSGQVPGIVTGPCLYDLDHAESDPSDHVFVRPIEWARDDRGELLALDLDLLPSGLHPARQTVTAVNEGKEQLDQLARLVDTLKM